MFNKNAGASTGIFIMFNTNNDEHVIARRNDEAIANYAFHPCKVGGCHAALAMTHYYIKALHHHIHNAAFNYNYLFWCFAVKIFLYVGAG